MEKKKNLTTNLLQNSLLLDRDILASLANIFLNGILNFNQKSEINENQISEKINSFLTSKNDSFDPNDNSELSKLNKKLKEVILIFEKVNRERKIFRELIMEMLKNKFWKIKEEEECGLFINRVEGLNLEILKKKIEKFEKEKTLFEKLDYEKDKKIKKLNLINENLTNEAKKNKDELMGYILNENKQNNRKAQYQTNRGNSIKPDFDFSIENPKKMTRNSRRKNVIGIKPLKVKKKEDFSYLRPQTSYSRNNSSRKFKVKSRIQSPSKKKDFSRTKTFVNNVSKRDYGCYDDDEVDDVNEYY